MRPDSKADMDILPGKTLRMSNIFPTIIIGIEDIANEKARLTFLTWTLDILQVNILACVCNIELRKSRKHYFLA